jgi:hypothetical protein
MPMPYVVAIAGILPLVGLVVIRSHASSERLAAPLRLLLYHPSATMTAST